MSAVRKKTGGRLSPPARGSDMFRFVALRQDDEVRRGAVTLEVDVEVRQAAAGVDLVGHGQHAAADRVDAGLTRQRTRHARAEDRALVLRRVDARQQRELLALEG